MRVFGAVTVFVSVSFSVRTFTVQNRFAFMTDKVIMVACSDVSDNPCLAWFSHCLLIYARTLQKDTAIPIDVA